MRQFFLLFFLIVLACSPKKDSLYRKSTILMDTLVTITVSAESPEKAESAIQAAFDEIRRLEGLISFWSKDSEIAALNRNAGVSPVRVSQDTLDIIKKAVFISEKTYGGFDPTIGPVIRLYDFKNRIHPAPDVLREKLRLVNYKAVVINSSSSTAYISQKGMSFDTGGIAKGYAAERAVKVLKDRGIKAGLVAIAGDIMAFGLRPDGSPWTVGIRNPRPKNQDDDVIATVKLKDEAISTSGDYERAFQKNGKLYHHILNPKSGLPAEGSMSVSVISKDGAYADGFSTGLFVLGPKQALKVAKELNIEAFIIDSEGNALMTEGLKERLHLKGSVR